MTRKQSRALLIGGAVGLLGLAAILVLFALRDSVVFFHSPSDVAEKRLAADLRFRLGGLVKDGSVKRGVGTQVAFEVTDTLKAIPVVYNGVLPDLFREGQGVVTEGKLGRDGVFVAEVDTYVPAEGYQDTAYSLTGLAPGSHTLTIEATGRMNPAATNNYVVVDAFDVRP